MLSAIYWKPRAVWFHLSLCLTPERGERKGAFQDSDRAPARQTQSQDGRGRYSSPSRLHPHHPSPRLVGDVLAAGEGKERLVGGLVTVSVPVAPLYPRFTFSFFYRILHTPGNEISAEISPNFANSERKENSNSKNPKFR